MTQQNTHPLNEIDIRELLHTYIKKWYWFAISVAVCLSLTILYIFKKTPVFEVSSTIMIRESDNGGLSGLANLEALSMLGMGGSKSVTDELEIYNSRSIMEQALRSLQLQTEYRKKKDMRWVGQYPGYDIIVHYPQHFCDTMTRSVQMYLTYRGDSWKLKVKYGQYFLKSTHTLLTLDGQVETCIGPLEFDILRQVEKGDKFRITTTPMPALVDIYRNNITAKQVKKGSNIVTISTATDMPRRAQALIGKLTELYNTDAVIDKSITTQNTKTFLEERLYRIAHELDSAELAIEHYKEKHNITSLTHEAELYLESAGEYRKTLVETETQLNLIDYISQFVSDKNNQNSLIPANLGINDPSLTGLINSYNQLLLKQMKVSRTATEQNPTILQLNEQLTVMRNNILNSIASVRDGLLITKADLQRQQDIFSGRVEDIPQQEREYVILRRQQQIKQTIYIFLYQKREENDLALISTVTPTRLVDKPQTTPDPVAPRLKLLLLLAIVLGICIPIGILFLLDMLNNKINTRKQYIHLLKAPVIGEMPYSRKAADCRTNLSLAESTGLLCSHIDFKLSANSSSTLLVTSTICGEGKSFITANIGMTLAVTGKRTIVLECNLRRPVLAARLHLQDNGNLCTWLSGNDTDLDTLVVPSGIHNRLDIIPAGTSSLSPSELLSSPRLDKLITLLKERYDYILIDSAPAGLVSDAFLLNRVADMTLYISRANYTTCTTADFINELSTQQRLNNMLCVLNGVKDIQADYGY